METIRGVNEITDEILYQRYRRGDLAAFEQLYRRYRRPLYLFLLRSGPSEADAEDLFQELWSRILTTEHGFREGSFRAWAFRIARNLRIDLFRRRNIRPVDDSPSMREVLAPEPGPEQRTQAEDCHRQLLQAISELPPDQREAFLLKEESRLSLNTIAEMAGVGRETLKSRLRYAFKRLRAALEDCL